MNIEIMVDLWSERTKPRHKKSATKNERRHHRNVLTQEFLWTPCVRMCVVVFFLLWSVVFFFIFFLLEFFVQVFFLHFDLDLLTYYRSRFRIIPARKRITRRRGKEEEEEVKSFCWLACKTENTKRKKNVRKKTTTIDDDDVEEE